jgi:Protein of unknown function (DUF3716)
VNYYYKGQPYFRKKCHQCSKQASHPVLSQPLWQQQGYQKKKQCDRCGFKSQIFQVMTVYVVDGDLRNTAPNNLRTVCANCQILLSVTGEGWRNAELISDF